jgi:REP element-mobilizing transposase RayT
MKYNPEIHHRRSIRLRGHDYSQPGAYFVTICTNGGKCLFGEILNGNMRLNDAGQIVRQCWCNIPVHFPHIELDGFVIMPNHIHGILIIQDTASVGRENFSAPSSAQTPLHQAKGLPQTGRRQPGTSKTIGSVVRGFKVGVTKWIRQNTAIHLVWQRNYWEHIIRNEPEFNRIREYIQKNPAQWHMDRLHPRRGEKSFAPVEMPEPAAE